MTDQQWIDECNANWDKAAAVLDADGWQKVEAPGFSFRGVATHWLKEGQKVGLRRELGSSNWFVKELH